MGLGWHCCRGQTYNIKLLIWAVAGIVAVASDERVKIHTFGGPRRRPCLGKGRGRRIKNGSSFDLMWDSPNFIVTIRNSSPFSWVLRRNHSQLIGLWHCLRMDQGEG